MLDQTKTPLLETLKTLANRPHAAFYAPGHKRGNGMNLLLQNVLGSSVFKADLPELPELDNLFAPEGVIESAQQLAAAAFGAEQTRFLVNGSTGGIIASILATCGTGDKIIMPRNVHQSVISGLVLSGAIPVFLQPEYNAEWDLTYSITPEAVETALKHHADIKAVLMVYPTYQGICGNIEQIAKITHDYNIPLLVDEAHGPHFYFHADLPIAALTAGADLVVQSTHKVLGAMTQASMLHLQGNRIDRSRLNQALQMIQSSSPSYLLLASLDAARQQMATQGQELMNQTLQLAETAKISLEKIPGISVLNLPKIKQNSFIALDSTRLSVNVSDLGLTGYQADEILHQQFGVTAELPNLKHLTFIISLGNTEADIEQLVKGFTQLSEMSHDFQTISPEFPLPPVFSSVVRFSPRDAFEGASQRRSVDDCIGCISAEMVCPYPPGIPILMPGEQISADAINYLHKVLSVGATITGCSDPTLETLKIYKSFH
ncbi:aminotransferase class I/II-fold pyridoxal phosphate-dependent enzyme [Lyngbya sp. PCC 8106]|uniref:aminotransferase class I/II-fold pyridoxal phosphate-dependent enzyme n=1 Tax=Lyngbya sp. (strain PCC 8106) TaxID=313612 RepID=UPI0002DF0D4A|nr:aminotransferase class I/II-fold pyridoxal phosphate-dependent enzyme [Lyngbya sp. PCC 8106]